MDPVTIVIEDFIAMATNPDSISRERTITIFEELQDLIDDALEELNREIHEAENDSEPS